VRAAALALAVLAAFCCQPACAGDPTEIIERVYAHYRVPGGGGLLSEDEKGTLLTRCLTSLLAEDEARSNAEFVGNLDFDPFVAGQDYDIEGVAIASEVVTGDKAAVTVDFANFGHRTKLTYSLLREDRVGKIDDIESAEPGHSWVLSEILKVE
jgi:hypothetical protein